MADQKKATHASPADAIEAATAVLGETVAELKADVEELKANSLLVRPQPEQPSPMPEAQEFQVGGKKYRFIIKKFIIEADVILAHEAAKNKELRERIVEHYPGVVAEV